MQQKCANTKCYIYNFSTNIVPKTKARLQSYFSQKICIRNVLKCTKSLPKAKIRALYISQYMAQNSVLGMHKNKTIALIFPHTIMNDSASQIQENFAKT